MEDIPYYSFRLFHKFYIEQQNMSLTLSVSAGLARISNPIQTDAAPGNLSKF